MTATNRSIWMRLGVSVFGNAEEIDKILNGDQPQLIKLLREGKFEIYGDTYIPDASIDDYNQTNGTHYAEQDVEFDINFKPAEHHDNKSDKLKICPACQEEALRYAMLDLDGTNLEEGYSCCECGEEFIGLYNREVIEFNPEITDDNE